MHGLGNDFVVFDGRKQPLALDRTAARAVADRRFGIGCDQVIVIAPGHGKFDAVMNIRNADGGEVESCGNAARCVARLLMEETGRDTVHIDTAGGPLTCSDAGNGLVTVDMGPPRLMWNEVPLAQAADTNMFQLNVDGANHVASAVSVGNPHVVLFVENAETGEEFYRFFILLQGFFADVICPERQDRIQEIPELLRETFVLFCLQ